MKHILCVSYDSQLLLARRLLLEGEGYRVTAAWGFKESSARCQDDGFDLFILGTSIPYSDKQKLIDRFRETSTAPILALWQPNERVLDTANYLTFSEDPIEFLKAVRVILAKDLTTPLRPRNRSSKAPRLSAKTARAVRATTLGGARRHS